MGVILDTSGNPLSGQNVSSTSGFIGGYENDGSLVSGLSWLEEKYYNKYNYGTSFSDFTMDHLSDVTYHNVLVLTFTCNTDLDVVTFRIVLML